MNFQTLSIVFLVLGVTFGSPIVNDDTPDLFDVENGVKSESQAKSSPASPQTICPQSGTYFCKSSILPLFKCVPLDQLCDGVAQCPLGDDENAEICASQLNDAKSIVEKSKETSRNTDFSGTGFMLNIDNLIITDHSNVKMFNQDSDNVRV